jgi:chemotaxis family two-component system response regulator Rcp1
MRPGRTCFSTCESCDDRHSNLDEQQRVAMITPESDEAQRQVLLVENHPGDVRLTREAFRNNAASVQLHVAIDGVEAMAFLRQEAGYADAPRPHLILLDLNLPKMGGLKVLGQIKSDRILKAIPTIILTTSDADSDISMGYQMHANCYLRKPAHWDAFDRLVGSINAFWLTRAKLPKHVYA